MVAQHDGAVVEFASFPGHDT